jgi:uncharacterized protein (DUF1778 family)
MEIRVQSDEKSAFKEAAAISGIPLSAWVRERLRRAAIKDLTEAGRQISFLQRARGDANS